MGTGDDRFLCDAMLGKLPVYLRMCGYDTAYTGERDGATDAGIREVLRRENRTLLSRDRELVARTPGAIRLERREITDQIAELRGAGIPLDLTDPPVRCGRCNGRLVREPANGSRPDYAPDDREVACYRCRSCGQYFWKGSHWDDVAARL